MDPENDVRMHSPAFQGVGHTVGSPLHLGLFGYRGLDHRDLLTHPRSCTSYLMR